MARARKLLLARVHKVQVVILNCMHIKKSTCGRLCWTKNSIKIISKARKVF
jgi:hypothetical protein